MEIKNKRKRAETLTSDKREVIRSESTREREYGSAIMRYRDRKRQRGI